MATRGKKTATAYDLTFRGRQIRLVSPIELAREGLDGIGWYPAAEASIRRYSLENHFSASRVADILAITSPQVSVSRNVQLAHQYLHSADTTGMMPTIIAGLRHYEQTGIVRGQKTGPFSRALLGDSNAVVLDVWMFRAFQLKYRSFTHKRYRDTATRVVAIANTLGTSPRDTQAAMWVATRRRYGFKTHAPLVMPSE